MSETSQRDVVRHRSERVGRLGFEQLERAFRVAGLEIRDREQRPKCRQARIVGDRGFDHRPELPEPSLLQPRRDELGRVEDERVGLAAFGSDLEGGFGALLGSLMFTTHDGNGGGDEGAHPHEGGLLQPRAQGAHHLEAAISLLEVAGLHRGGDGIGTRPGGGRVRRASPLSPALRPCRPRARPGGREP